MNTEEARRRIAEVVVDPLAAVGLDVEAVELAVAGRRRSLRIALDKDGGVTLDDIADATKEIDRLLDEADVMGEHPYTLEVTSRGVDRPLTLPRHWRRNEDRLVKVTTAADESFTGRIKHADEGAVDIDVDGALRTLPYAEVVKARIEIEFNRKED